MALRNYLYAKNIDDSATRSKINRAESTDNSEKRDCSKKDLLSGTVNAADLKKKRN